MWSQIRRWIAYPLGWLALMLVPMMVWQATQGPGAGVAADRVNRFQIQSFDASYDAAVVADKMKIRVTERIVAHFPNAYTNRGIERRLDARYGGQSIRLSDFAVADGTGKRIPMSQRTVDDGDVVLRIGDPKKYVSGTVTYVISYTIGNGMVLAGDRQEIYLDVNGTGWLQPMGRVSATVRLQGDLPAALLGQEACYQGPAGSNQRCAITRTSSNTFTSSVGPLQPRENMTVAIGFRPGTVTTGVNAPPRILGLGWVGIAILPAFGGLLLGIALVMRWLRRRATESDGAAVTEFTPPEDLPAVTAADFLARPEKGAAAQLAELVINDQAVISSRDQPTATAPQRRGFLGLGRREQLRSELAVQLRDPETTIKGATLREVCTALFGDGSDPVPLGGAAEAEIARATTARTELLDVHGLRKPSQAAGWLLGLGMVGLVGFGWYQLAIGLPYLAWPFLGFGLLAVMLVVAATHYYPRTGGLTDKGKAVRRQLLGLQRFVTMAEGERINWMQNAVDAPRVKGAANDPGALVKLYEPLLPYAIIFGAERTWNQVLGDLYQTFEGSWQAPLDVPTLALTTAWAESGSPSYYDRREASTHSFWDSRPVWGEGWVSHAGQGLGEIFDSWQTSRDDDSGGGSSGWSNSSSGSSRSSSSSSSGSSGGGSSGGGMGGGGGGGW